MITRKNQEIYQVVRKSAKDPMNSKMGVCPSIIVLKGVCPSRTTHKDQEIDQVARKICKRSDELKDMGMP